MELSPLNRSLYILSRALDRVTRNRVRLLKYYLIAQPVRRERIAAPFRQRALTVRKVESADPVVTLFPRPESVIRERFRMGAHCFVAESNGTFAGFLWLQENSYEEDEVRCLFVPTPANRSVWDFDVYVDPEFRLGRAFARLWDAADKYLQSRCFAWTTSRISAFNIMSLKSHAALGAVSVGWVVFLVAGSFQMTVSPGAPYLHMSFARTSRPTIQVRVPDL